MKRAIVGCLVALVVGCGPALAPLPPVPTPPLSNDVVQQLLTAHNQIRAQQGLKPLMLSPLLQRAAQGHADYQARVRQMAHSGIGDGDPFSRITGTGYRWSQAGENIAWGQPTVAAVMAAWMGDAGHRDNILGNYTECGLAMTAGYWTVDFARPLQAGEQVARPSGQVSVRAGAHSATSSVRTHPGATR